MRKALIVLTLLFTFVLGLTLVAADDAQPEPGSPEDNACNPGGVLYREANQDGCPSEWYWKAGWFLARFLSGDISRADFPKEFESVLPPLPAATVTSICHTDGSGYSLCLHSNQTGNGTIGGIGTVYLLLVADVATCPANYGGFPLQETTTNQSWMIDYGFTPDEIATLGLLQQACAYYVVT